jgi:hypothetical protein
MNDQADRDVLEPLHPEFLETEESAIAVSLFRKNVASSGARWLPFALVWV